MPEAEATESPAAVTPQRRLLDNDAAAEYLCLSPKTMNKMRCDGVGPAFRKLGKRVVYELADLDAWVDSKQRQEKTKA